MRLYIRALFLSFLLILATSCPQTTAGVDYLSSGDMEVFCGTDYAAEYKWDNEVVIVLGTNLYKNSIDRHSTAQELGISIKNADGSVDLSNLFQAKNSVDAKAKKIELFYAGYSSEDSDADVPQSEVELEVSIDADMLEKALELTEEGVQPEELYIGSFNFKRSAQAVFDEDVISKVIAFECNKPVSRDNAQSVNITLKGAKFNACDEVHEVGWFSNSLPSYIKVLQLETPADSHTCQIKFVSEDASNANPIESTDKAIKLHCLIPSEYTTLDEDIKTVDSPSLFITKKESERQVRISDCPTLATPGWDVEKRDIKIYIEGDCIYQDIPAFNHLGEPTDFTSILQDGLPDGVGLYLQDDIKAGDNEFTVYIKGSLATEDDSSATSTGMTNSTLYKFDILLKGRSDYESDDGSELRLLSQSYDIKTNSKTGYGEINTRNDNAYFLVYRVASFSYKIINPKPLESFSTDIVIALDNRHDSRAGGKVFSQIVGDYTRTIRSGLNVSSWFKNDLSSAIKDFKALVHSVELYEPYKGATDLYPLITIRISGSVLDIQKDFEDLLCVEIPHNVLPFDSKALEKLPYENIRVMKSNDCRFKISAD